MKILAIGDIHGKTVWEKIIRTVTADKIVFIGDYVIANQWIGNGKQIVNLERLIAFKRNAFDHVHLLIGNHDLCFLHPDLFRWPLIKGLRSLKLYNLYRANEDVFEVAFQHENFLFSHAGVSNPWYKAHTALLDINKNNLAQSLNALERSEHYQVLHEKGQARGGPFLHGGVTYADKVETQKDALRNYCQIVGHSKVLSPTKFSTKDASIIYIDCLNTVDQCLMIDHSRTFVYDSNGRMVCEL